MRTTATIATVSWIPSESITGPLRAGYDAGVVHFDAPPPDAPPRPEDLEDAGEIDVIEDLEAVDQVEAEQVGGSELPEQDRVGIDSGARSVDQ